MSNVQDQRNDGVIPSKGKGVATPVNSTNTDTSFYEYTKKEQIKQRSKSNNLY